MNLRVAVRGEGPNDFGRWDVRRRRLEQEGCYLAFLKTAISDDVRGAGAVFDCIFAGRFPKKLPGSRHKRGLPRLKGFERHAFYSTLEAREEGADWLVIGTDADRGLEEKKRRLPAACRERYSQLRKGYEKAKRFRSETAQVGFVPLVPLVKLESWLLADEKGFRKAAGFERGPLPEKPEELYGSTDAKRYLDSLFRRHRKRDADTSDKARLAEETSAQALARECPVSYPPFLKNVQTLLRAH